MFFFEKEDVYIGFSLAEVAKIIEALAREGIKYTYKVVDHSGWGRGRRGSFGLNPEYQRQYAISVHKKDSEKAKYLVNKALYF